MKAAGIIITVALLVLGMVEFTIGVLGDDVNFIARAAAMFALAAAIK